MDNYIKQLLKDIDARIAVAPPPIGMVIGENVYPISDSTTLEESLGEAERYVSAPPAKLGDQLKFTINEFPRATLLNTKQLTVLTQALENLWLAWHLVPDFPKGLPVAMKYNLMRDYLEKEIVLVKVGEVHIEFCEYDYDNCPFIGYCDSCDPKKFTDEKLN